MTRSLEALVSDLASHLVELEVRGRSDGFAQDLFEAVQNWTDLGRLALNRDTLVNFPVRAESELRALARLQRHLTRVIPEKQQLYAPLFIAGSELLKTLETILPSESGHLGIVTIIRNDFRYLETEYGFSAIEEAPTGVRYSSGRVYLRLEYAKKAWMSCRFGLEPEGERFFAIDDLLYLYRDDSYTSLPENLALDAENGVKEWFGMLASVFRKYGKELLTNTPGIFDRLAKAQVERDAEYAQEMNKLRGRSQNGRLPST